MPFYILHHIFVFYQILGTFKALFQATTSCFSWLSNLPSLFSLCVRHNGRTIPLEAAVHTRSRLLVLTLALAPTLAKARLDQTHRSPYRDQPTGLACGDEAF